MFSLFEKYSLSSPNPFVFVKDIDENIKLTKYIYLKASDSKIISEFSIPLEKAPFLSNKKFEG